jgi:hypothetical protein
MSHIANLCDHLDRLTEPEASKALLRSAVVDSEQLFLDGLANVIILQLRMS